VLIAEMLLHSKIVPQRQHSVFQWKMILRA